MLEAMKAKLRNWKIVEVFENFIKPKIKEMLNDVKGVESDA